MDGMKGEYNAMDFRTLLSTIQDYQHAGTPNLEVLTGLMNNTFGAWLVSRGVSSLEMLNENKLCFNVMGELKTDAQPRIDGIAFYNRFFTVLLSELFQAPNAIADALRAYNSDGDGAYVWLIPDGYMAALTPSEQDWEQQGGGYFSHESICISNTADRDTRCHLEVLYEDTGIENVTCEFDVPAHRSVHYRLDKLKTADGAPVIRKDAPVSYKITSHAARIVVQGSRILTSGENNMFASFGTVMAWCPQ